MFIRKADYDKLVKSNREGWDKAVAIEGAANILRGERDVAERRLLAAQSELAGAAMERVMRETQAEELRRTVKTLEERLSEANAGNAQLRIEAAQRERAKRQIEEAASRKCRVDAANGHTIVTVGYMTVDVDATLAHNENLESANTVLGKLLAKRDDEIETLREAAAAKPAKKSGGCKCKK